MTVLAITSSNQPDIILPSTSLKSLHVVTIFRNRLNIFIFGRGNMLRRVVGREI